MLQENALELLQSVSPHGKSLENHCLRLAELTFALGERDGTKLDEDLILASCYLHDIGLLVTDPSEKNYLLRGLNYARPHMEKWGVSGEPLGVFEDVMRYSHSIRSVPGISPAGELVRLAVRTEHSLGRIRNGLKKDRIRKIVNKYPRLEFNRVLAAFFRTAVLDDGLPELVRVFFPKSDV